MGLIENIIVALERILPAIVGSAGSLLWISGGHIRKTGVFILGVFVGLYLGDLVGKHFDVSEEGSLLLTSLFSVSIIDKVFKAIDQSSILGFLSALGRNLK